MRAGIDAQRGGAFGEEVQQLPRDTIEQRRRGILGGGGDGGRGADGGEPGQGFATGEKAIHLRMMAGPPPKVKQGTSDPGEKIE